MTEPREAFDDPHSVRSAYRWLLAAVVLSLLAFGVGAAWDRAWHTRNPFEDFFSPPHLFIYTTHFLATLALAKIAFTPLGIQGDPKNTSPIPYIVPAVAFVALARTRLGEAWAWRSGGLLYGIAAGAVWPSGPFTLLAAAPAMALGAPLGEKVADIVRSPDVRVWRLLLGVGVGLPAVTGGVDLFLRSRTP